MNTLKNFVERYWEKYWEKKDSPKDYSYKADLVKRLVPLEKKLRVLDFGCGKGIITQDMLSINSSLKITGVDVSKIAIESARKRMPQQKFYIIGDDERLPFKNNSFDFITALDVLLFVQDTELIFKELSRILKPQGKLLITLPYYGILKNIVIAFLGFDQVYNPRGACIRYYTKKSLINEIKAVGLTPIKFGYFGRFYPFSNGMYCISRK